MRLQPTALSLAWSTLGAGCTLLTEFDSFHAAEGVDASLDASGLDASAWGDTGVPTDGSAPDGAIVPADGGERDGGPSRDGGRVECAPLEEVSRERASIRVLGVANDDPEDDDDDGVIGVEAGKPVVRVGDLASGGRLVALPSYPSRTPVSAALVRNSEGRWIAFVGYGEDPTAFVDGCLVATELNSATCQPLTFEGATILHSDVAASRCGDAVCVVTSNGEETLVGSWEPNAVSVTSPALGFGGALAAARLGDSMVFAVASPTTVRVGTYEAGGALETIQVGTSGATEPRFLATSAADPSSFALLLRRSSGVVLHTFNVSGRTTLTPSGERLFSRDAVARFAATAVGPYFTINEDLYRFAPSGDCPMLRLEAAPRALLLTDGELVAYDDESITILEEP